MRYPAGLWMPGPPNKVYAQRNTIAGIVCHSMEGAYSDAYNILMSTAEKSWHFSDTKMGVIYQHYELEASPWHAGNSKANSLLIGIEHEGVAGEPLTEAQVQASVALCKWIADIPIAWPLVRHQTLFEHNEVWNWDTPNAGPTNCPSDRIPWDRYVSSSAPPAAIPPNTNISPGPWDIGAGRIPAEQIIEIAAREHKRNAGTLDNAIAAVQRGYA